MHSVVFIDMGDTAATNSAGEPITLETLYNLIKSNHESQSQSIAQISNEVNILSTTLGTTSEEVQKATQNISGIQTVLSTQEQVLSSVSKKQDNLSARVAILEGVVQKQALKIRELEQKQLYSTARSMQNNIQFFNIPETPGEDVRSVIVQFLMQQMKMSEDDVKRVDIMRVHRAGPLFHNRPRKIVACMKRPDIVFSHRQNLDMSKYQMAQQFPVEISETRKELKNVMKAEFPNTQDKKLIVDSLYVGGEKYVPRFLKEDNAPRLYNSEHVDFQKEVPQITVAGETQESGNIFLGYTASVDNLEQARLVLDAIVAKQGRKPPIHLAFSYILSSQSGIEYQYDDGEAGAGSAIRTVLQNSGTRCQLVAIARWTSGNKLGQKRVRDLYQQTSRRVLRKALGENWKPVVNIQDDWN